MELTKERLNRIAGKHAHVYEERTKNGVTSLISIAEGEVAIETIEGKTHPIIKTHLFDKDRLGLVPGYYKLNQEKTVFERYGLDVHLIIKEGDYERVICT